jgi:hypothetical protein
MNTWRMWAGATLLLLAGGSGADEACGGCAPATRVSGFVDASYSGNLDTGGDGFRLDQVEVDVEHQAGGGVVLRADLESAGDGAVTVEQGWARLPLPRFPSHQLTVGKFNAPMGVELLDAPDMLQYSHSLLFDHGLPANLTGALLEGQLAGPADYKLFVVNGWDLNDEGNASRSWGGRLGTALGDLGGAGLSFILGREDGVKTGGPEDLQVVDLGVQLQPRESLGLFAELNLGTVTPVGGDDLAWTGWMLGGHLDFHPVWGVTLRYDNLADGDGVLFGLPGGETRSSLTAALTAAAGPGRAVVLEVRLDASNEDVFPDGDGGLAASTLGMALEFTQSF